MVDFRAYFSDNSGKLIFSFGAVFLAVGVLSSNYFGTVLSAVTLFLGILMVVFGLFLQLGLFSGDLRSLSVIGMILVCAAIVLFAFSLVALEFLDIVSTKIVAIAWRGVGVLGYHIILNVERPYVWISDLCFKFGLGFLMFGIGMKIAGLLRH